jgi:hypothetical protein
LYKICKESLKCHVPIEAIQAKFKKHERRVPVKAISMLARLGLVTRHPTKGGITYQLTRLGKEYVETQLREFL